MPATVFATRELYKYQNGFDNHLEYVLFQLALQTRRNETMIHREAPS